MSFPPGPGFLSPLLLGFTSMVLQILLLRGMVVIAYGNELSLGFMLSAWLVWVGMGSLLGGWLARRFFPSARSLALAYGLLGLGVPASLLFIRSARPLLGIGPGEAMALPTILLLSFLLSFPLCLLLGLLFVFNAYLFSRGPGEAGEGISFVYLWEALGAFLGGILFTFLPLPHLTDLQISFLLLFLNLMISLHFLPGTKGKRGVAQGLLVLALLSLSLLRLPSTLDFLSWQSHWRGFRLLQTSDTPYGHLAVAERQGQISLFQNGLRLLSYPDRATAEEAIHYALLQHPDPRTLFLLGGGVGGGLAEALKYPKLTIDYAELDPSLIYLTSRNVPGEGEVLEDLRVRVHYGDGRLLLRQSGKRYDVILLNLPDPYTLQLNRFYTQAFFQMVRDHLAPGGIFSFRLSSSENYIGPDLARYLSSMQNTLRSVFAEVVAFPGETCIYFASLQEGMLLRDPAALIQRLRERRLQNQYVNEHLLPFRLHPFKMNYLNQRLRGEEARTNQDLEPICYFYEATLWASQFGAWETRLFSLLLRTPWGIGLLMALFPLALLLLWQAVHHSFSSGAILGSVFVTGWTSISLEIAALLSFQISYGLIYQKMGLLLAAFMLGLGVGAIWGRKKGASRKWLLSAQAALMGLCLLFLFAVRPLIPGISPLGWMEAFFFSFLLLVGGLGGMQFCLANALFLRDHPQATWGTPYAVDLWGSALGALLFSALLIPLWGVPRSLVTLALLNLAALTLLLGTGYESRNC
ncbi:MAG: fused MFS/spermidine synthase [candidate division NC10 bacterium]|nr:fused MFS/spermidine synthase [candidate division NC10 bacterium]